MRVVPRRHPGQVRQLANRRFEAPRLDGIGRMELTEQPGCRHPEGAPQLLRPKAAHQRSLQLASDPRRQGVGPPGVVDGLPEAKAGKGQRLVPDAADPVLGLPGLAAFDAAPSVQHVMPAKPDAVPGVRWRGRGWRDRPAEDPVEVRAMGAELAGRGEAEVDLKAGRQQKRPVDRIGHLELEVVQGGKLAVEVVGPIGDDRIQRDVVGDAEVQVDVGPSILPAVRRGAGHRSSRDPRILLGEPEQLAAQPITMVAGKHLAESSWRLAAARVVGQNPDSSKRPDMPN